jgi:hypothetical protein
VSDKLFKVFTRLLDPCDEEDELLDPVRGLEEVVDFKAECHFSMGVIDPEVLGLVDWLSARGTLEAWRRAHTK